MIRSQSRHGGCVTEHGETVSRASARENSQHLQAFYAVFAPEITGGTAFTGRMEAEHGRMSTPCC